MNRRRFVRKTAVFVVVLLIVIMRHPLNAQVGSSDQAEALAKDFVKAINDKSVDERKKILHPKTVSCINRQTQPYFDWIFSRQFKHVIPANYSSKTRPSTGIASVVPEAKADYPISPTHILQIDYSTKPFSGTSIMLAPSSKMVSAGMKSCHALNRKPWP